MRRCGDVPPGVVTVVEPDGVKYEPLAAFKKRLIGAGGTVADPKAEVANRLAALNAAGEQDDGDL